MTILEKKVQIIKNKYKGVEDDEEELVDRLSDWKEKNRIHPRKKKKGNQLLKKKIKWENGKKN